MISYCDIRAAQSAMRALQNKSLRRRKLDIHFSIPKVLDAGFREPKCVQNWRVAYQGFYV